MAVNLATKYEKQFAEAFKPNSFFEGKTNTKYKFDGAKSIEIYSPVTTELVDYVRGGANRYGEPTEMDTVTQKMELTQDKGFTKTLDRGNHTDQMMAISAGAWMKEQIKSVVTPTSEKYAVSQWVRNAGKIVTINEKAAKNTIVEALALLSQALTDGYVPEDGRYLYISADAFTKVKLSDQFVSNDTLGVKTIEKGVLGEFMGAKVVVLPTSFLPENCYAFVARKESILLPRKISSYKTHNNPPGIDGWLMEGRVYYDAFVLGAAANGVAALVLAADKQATPEINASGSSVTITSSGATEIRYTTDGSDPRYSGSAKVYGGAVTLEGDATVKAVAYGKFTSDVAEEKVTV